MNPPSVYDYTIPSSHSTSRITKIVHSIPASQRMCSTAVQQTRTSYRQADLIAVMTLTRGTGCRTAGAGDEAGMPASGPAPMAVLS
jgi:hypothetical protein